MSAVSALTSPARRRLARAAGIAVGLLGQRDQLAQQVDFLGNRLAAAEQDFGEFLEAEQPERQVERGGVDADREFGQRRREFVVRVEDQHAQVGARLDRLSQQQRDGGRLADAGRAEHRKVAVQRIVDRDAGVDGLVLRQLADGDRAAPREIVDGGEIARADAVGDGADIRDSW